jgi:hypothetical protein
VSYLPYPSEGSFVGTQLRERPPQPASLGNAVRLMWLGAGVAAVTTIVEFAVRSKIKAAVFHGMHRNAGHQYTVAQVHQFATVTVVAYLVAGVISILLWVWMARANNLGRGWARICATVLFGLDTVGVFLSLHRASFSIFFLLAEWLIGAGAIALLWRRETTQFVGAG